MSEQKKQDNDAPYRRPDDAPEPAELGDSSDAAATSASPASVDAGVVPESHTTSSPAPPPAAAPVSRWPVILALLVALGSLGVSGFLFYELRLRNPVAPLAQRVDERVAELAAQARATSGELAAETQSLRTEFERAITAQTEQAAALRAEIEAEQDGLAAAQAALATTLGETLAAAPPSDRDWKLAEAEYLLRIANHRLLMEQDARAAGQLLTTADRILAEVGDFSLHDVRARLADEILSLRSAAESDQQGLYLQLEALKNSLQALPLRLPEYMQAKVAPQQSLEEALTTPAAADNTVWQQVAGRLSAFFDYRRIEGPETRRPLLSPEEATYLEMNLRLMLERSQLALLRRNQMVYEQSLSTAADWMDDYLDPAHPAVAESQRQIEELLGVQVEQPMPDISGSLNSLQAITRGSRE